MTAIARMSWTKTLSVRGDRTAVIRGEIRPSVLDIRDVFTDPRHRTHWAEGVNRREWPMHAKVVTGQVNAQMIDQAICAAHGELIPGFVATSNAERGLWLVNRDSCQFVEISYWWDRSSLEDARVPDGANRTQFAERYGVSITAVLTCEVIGSTSFHAPGQPLPEWARVSWVSGLSRQHDARLRSLHPGVAAGQAAAPGFSGGCWLADYDAGNGVGLSLWSSRCHMNRRESEAQAVRRQFERTVGCSIERVCEFGVVDTTSAHAPSVIDLGAQDPGHLPSSAR